MILCNLSNTVEPDNKNDNKIVPIAISTRIKRTFIIFGVRLDARRRFETQAIATMESGNQDSIGHQHHSIIPPM